MGTLVQREFFSPDLLITATGRLDSPMDVWVGIYDIDGERAGFINIKANPSLIDGSEGARIEIRSIGKYLMLGTVNEYSVRGTGWVPFDWGVASLDIKMHSGGHDVRIEAVTLGDALDLKLHVREAVIPIQLPVGAAAVDLGRGLLGAFELPDLMIGDEFVVKTFDPMRIGVGEARLRYMGEEEYEYLGEIIETRMFDIEMSGTKSRAWVSSDGEIMRYDSPFGFIFKRVSIEEALGLAPAIYTEEPEEWI